VEAVYERYGAAVGEGSTARIEAMACIFWTRVMRHNTTEPTVGSVLFEGLEEAGGVVLERGIEMIGLLFLFAAGVVVVEPTIEA